jgi:hypothetical protein
MWFLSNATSAPGTIRDRVCGDPELVAATVRVMSAGGGASLAAAATLRHISERYEYAPCLLRCGYTNNAPPHNDNNNDDNNEAAEGRPRGCGRHRGHARDATAAASRCRSPRARSIRHRSASRRDADPLAAVGELGCPAARPGISLPPLRREDPVGVGGIGGMREMLPPPPPPPGVGGRGMWASSVSYPPSSSLSSLLLSPSATPPSTRGLARAHIYSFDMRLIRGN